MSKFTMLAAALACVLAVISLALLAEGQNDYKNSVHNKINTEAANRQ